MSAYLPNSIESLNAHDFEAVYFLEVLFDFWFCELLIAFKGNLVLFEIFLDSVEHNIIFY